MAALAPAPPDVTVTVIVHNDAARLPRAIASVRRQTLRNVEIIISDDHSTDATPEVARSLAGQDPRIRYLRLPENSGGCSAPRNAAIGLARAPHLMFLDSDDELPEDAAATLLDALRTSGADFAMGGVARVRTDTGRTSAWHPDLFTEARTVRDIADSPEYFFDALSTNKMYRRAFIDRCDLRFPLGVHYEDQLFSAQAYCLARSFAVVPGPVYRWYIAPYDAPDALSISNQRHRIGNVRDRVTVSRLIDAFLDAHGRAALRPERDYKFLKHDLRMYTGDLPLRDLGWIEQFAEVMCPYLGTLSPHAYARLPRDQRVVIGLLRSGRPAEARTAARALGHAIGPREVTPDGNGRVFWGTARPADPAVTADLDVSDLHLTTRPFPRALLRHEVTRLAPGPGTTADLTVRTWDPGRQLPIGPVVATVQLGAGKGLSASFRLELVRPGLYEGTVRLDLSAARLPFLGLDGVRHARLCVGHRGQRCGGWLLAPLASPPLGMRVRNRRTGTHRVTLATEPRGAGRLQVSWERQGLAAPATALLAPVRRLARPRAKHLRGLWRGLTT